jgi:hypothetical protein
MIGELTSPGEEGAADIAKAAIDLAPSDPRSRWILGAVLRSDLSGESSAASVERITESVRLSPIVPSGHLSGPLNSRLNTLFLIGSSATFTSAVRGLTRRSVR